MEGKITHIDAKRAVNGYVLSVERHYEAGTKSGSSWETDVKVFSDKEYGGQEGAKNACKQAATKCFNDKLENIDEEISYY